MKEAKILIDTPDCIAIRYGLVLCTYNFRTRIINVSAFFATWLDVEIAIAEFKNTIRERGLRYE